MLNFFTRLTALGASQKLALSFRAMPQDKHQHISVVPPLLRQDVLQQESQPGDYIHGYMLNAGFSETFSNGIRSIRRYPCVSSGTTGKKSR